MKWFLSFHLSSWYDDDADDADDDDDHGDADGHDDDLIMSRSVDFQHGQT